MIFTERFIFSENNLQKTPASFLKKLKAKRRLPERHSFILVNRNCFLLMTLLNKEIYTLQQQFIDKKCNVRRRYLALPLLYQKGFRCYCR